MSAEFTNAESSDAVPSPGQSASYAGDVAPEDAYAALAAEEDAVLVDVRTAAEWSYVGLPDLSPIGKRVVCVEWQRFPDGAVNGDFVEQLQDAGLPDGAPIYFICRSGVRSIAAAKAATRAGLGPAYNVLEGFEGPHDEHGHRAVAGWKNAGLPWRQG
jgi:rhodanese-related sulfurtransferase